MSSNNGCVREKLSIFERRAGTLLRKAVQCCTGYEEYDDLNEKIRPVLQIGLPTNFRHEKINIPGLEEYGYRPDSPGSYSDMEKPSRLPSNMIPSSTRYSQYPWTTTTTTTTTTTENDRAPPYREVAPLVETTALPEFRPRGGRHGETTALPVFRPQEQSHQQPHPQPRIPHSMVTTTPTLARMPTFKWNLEEMERCSLRSGAAYGHSEKWREELLTKLRLVGTR